MIGNNPFSHMFNIINEYNLTPTTLFPKPNKEVFFFFFTESNQTATEKLKREKKIISDGDSVPGTMVLLKAVLESCQAKDLCSTSPYVCVFPSPVVFVPAFNCICLLATVCVL